MNRAYAVGFAESQPVFLLQPNGVALHQCRNEGNLVDGFG